MSRQSLLGQLLITAFLGFFVSFLDMATTLWVQKGAFIAFFSIFPVLFAGLVFGRQGAILCVIFAFLSRLLIFFYHAENFSTLEPVSSLLSFPTLQFIHFALFKPPPSPNFYFFPYEKKEFT